MNERTAMHEPERKSAGGIHGSFQHIYIYIYRERESLVMFSCILVQICTRMQEVWGNLLTTLGPTDASHSHWPPR